ncbi:MAG: beta strand repeat-containing protein [Tepidisphaeraceae bacterium]
MNSDLNGGSTSSGHSSQCARLPLIVAACVALVSSQAFSSDWQPATGGAWDTPTNWDTNPTIPDGVGATADFSQVDLTGDATIALNGSRTVGMLNFGDTDPSTAGGWLLSDATQKTLTLATSSGPANINVGNLGTGKAVTIASLLKVDAAQVVTKTGNGTLIFTNVGNASASAFAGILEIQAGVFQVGSTAALPNFDPNTVRINGGTMRFSASANTGRVFSLGQNGGTLSIAAATNFSGTGAMPLVGSGARTFTINTETAGAYTFANLIGDGTGGVTSLVKAGPGALTLGTANTFTGTIAVNGSTLTNNTLGGTPTGPAATATAYTGGGITVASGATMGVTRGLSLNFAGSISGAGGLNVKITNDGNVSLGNATFAGTTTIQRGTYNLSNNSATSNYVLGDSVVSEYGIINLDNGNFTAPLGTTGGGVTWTGSGGFSNPNAGTRVVALGGTASPTPLQLNVGGFVAGNNSPGTPATDFRLKLGDVGATALGTVDFQNAIDLNNRELRVTVDGLAQAPGILSGNITGTGRAAGALAKFGNASLILSGNNTYTGITSIVAGNAPTFSSAIILGSAGAFSPNSNIQLNGGTGGTAGGVLGLGFADGNFTLGTGGGQVGFTANNSGGFAAYGADRTVTLNSNALLTWGSTASFITSGQNLILALQNADSRLTLSNDINLNGAARTVVVNQGSAAVDARLSGQLTGTGSSGLTKSGLGTLELTNTANNYAGVTNVTAGTLLVNGSTGAGKTTVSAGATLGGSGTISGDLAVIGGTLAPGNSPASLEIGGNLTLDAASTTAIELAGTAFSLNGTEQYDRLKLTSASGSHTIAGTLAVDLLNGFTLTDNEAFGILQLDDAALRSGTFTGLTTDGALVGTFGGQNLFITYSGSFGDAGAISTTGGNDVVLYTQQTPEPAALGLLGGAAMMLVRRRRRV